jgi:peptidyl-prolyl cis-trans isomerase C
VKRIIAVTFALAVTAGSAFAQDVARPNEAAAGTDPVVIRFAGSEIRKSEFEAAVKSIPEQYQSYANGPGRRAFAEDLIRMRLLAGAAEKSGLEKDPEVAGQLRLLRMNTLANAQLSKMQEAAAVPPADLQKAYDEKKASFDRAKARHILIAFKGSAAQQPGKKELTDEEAKAKAEELRAKLVAGADFAATAKAESDDLGSGANGGDLGSFSRGQMVPEFEKAAFEGKVGEISPVVRTDYGYHIVQVQERGPAPLAEVREQLEGELKQKKLQDAIEKMKNEANPVFDETYFAAPPAPAAAPAAPPAPKP